VGTRWDETWHRLSEWTSGQGPSERLAAQVLFDDGFTSLDPSHPLGGRDGGKDAIAWRSGEKWVMAVYFPRGRRSLREIKEKLVTDFVGVAGNKADGLAFVTNQELSLGERSELQDSVPGRVEIYHLERITAILDKPAMRSVRAQFLGIDSEQDTTAPKPIFIRTIPSFSQALENLIGREQDIEILSRFLGSPPDTLTTFNTLVITGMPGVGKTALAIQAASNAVSQGVFSGGAITIDFNGYAVNASDRVQPQQVISSMLLALGSTQAEYEPSMMFVHLQSTLAKLEASGKRVLLLFDNVSQVDQVQTLVPISSAHRIILTSRNALAPRLPSSEELRLSPLSRDEGVKLIGQTSRYSGKEILFKDHSVQVGLERLAIICSGLPIAMHIVGEILRNEQALTPNELAEELESASTRLAGLEFEDATIRAIFEGSYIRLPEIAARCFRYISIYPGQEFSVESVAALLRMGKLETRRAFRVLEGSHLIVRDLDRSTWTMHDLLLLYSAELFEIQDCSNAAESALSSLYDYYFVMAEQASEWLNANSTMGEQAAFESWSDARAWMSTETSGIVASEEAASISGDFNNAFRLAITVGLYLDIKGDKTGCLAMAEAALRAARALKDSKKEASALNNVGLALNSMQRFSEAKSIFLEARKKFQEAGDRSGQASVLLGLCDVLRSEGSIGETVGPLKRAARLYMDDEDARGAGFALTNLGIALREGGKFTEAIDVLLSALRIHEETGARRAEGSTLVHLGTALMQSGNHADGLPYLLRGRDCAKDVGDMAGLASACVNIGNLYRELGDLQTAKTHYLDALKACQEVDDTTSLAMVLWNLIGLSRDAGDSRAASDYLRRLRSIPWEDLPYMLKKRLHGGV
jgi:tetratricopeptide (TPR) repeat protein